MLYLVPTPVGNLGDITFRAVEVLKTADRILCEDTRTTQKLLKHYEISRPLVSFHEHNEPARIREILDSLEKGENVALVSDAGTPLVSDPGYKLVREAVCRGFEVTALPGPCAAVSALVLSGLAPDAFSFFGFVPKKPGTRKNFLESLKGREETLIFYESPYRAVKTLEAMKEVFGDREAALVREISKKFEEAGRGRLSDLIMKFSEKEVLGELVLVVAGQGSKAAFA